MPTSSNPLSICIPCKVNLESRDYHIVNQVARNRGLGSNGFSTALCLIIREWSAIRKAYPELVIDLKLKHSDPDSVEASDPDQFIHPPFP